MDKIDEIDEFIKLSEAVSKRADEIKNELKESLETLNKARERIWEMYFKGVSNAS